MIVRLAEQPGRTEDHNPILMRRLIDTERHTAALSMTWVQLSGRHVRLRTDVAERVYIVLAGTGTFQVGDDEPFEVVGAGDVVFIPKAVPYEFAGHFTYLVINAPGFRDGDDVVIGPTAGDRWVDSPPRRR